MTGNLNGTIFIDENIPLLAEAFKNTADVITFRGRSLARHDLLEKKCAALIVRSTTKVNRELLEGTNVQFVGSATSGIDHIDKAYLEQADIHLASANGSNANSVAEYVVYSMLKWADMRHIQLNNQTIGIVGYGNIGRLVMEYAYHIGMRPLVNDPPLRDEGYEFPDYVQYAQLEDICGTSAVITNHVPLTKDGDYPTFRLFSERQISLINEKSLFIHASRGYVVEEAALYPQLVKKYIYAAIDVWENEPLINIDLAKKTILSTPHIAGYSRDGKIRGSMMIAEAIKNFFDIQPDMDLIFSELASYSPIPEEDFMKEDYIYERLKKSRCLEEDHAAFLWTLSLPDDKRAEAFDLLRKNYPERREIL